MKIAMINKYQGGNFSFYSLEKEKYTIEILAYRLLTQLNCQYGVQLPGTHTTPTTGTEILAQITIYFPKVKLH